MTPQDVYGTPHEIASEFLLGELIKAATRRFKHQPTTFERMPQDEQEELLRAVATDCRRAVEEAIAIIVSDYRVTLRADCDAVNFKPDGVKATLSLRNTDEAHALANAAGSTLLVVIEDASRYLEVGDATTGEADQRSMMII